MPKTRPQPTFEDGRFVPSVPIPRDIKVADYNLRLSIQSVFMAARNPLETFTAMQYKIPVAQYMIAGNYITLINDPDLVKHCMVENRGNYGFSTIRQRILKPMLGDGLITAEGQTWRHARRTMSPMFTPRNVSSFASGMQATTERELPRLFGDVNGHGEVMKTAPLLTALTYLVLSDAIFTGDIGEDSGKVVKDVATALQYTGRPDPLDFLNAPAWVPRLTTLRGLNAIKRIRAMIKKFIALRKDEKTSGKDLPDDFLTRLMLAESEDGAPAFDDTQIEDHLIAFIGAGHETTARGLAWMLYILANDTAARERLEAEVDALDMTTPPENWGEQLPWATACFEETMRLYPPAPLIARYAKEDDLCGHVFIPERTTLFINTWIMHRHEQLWDNPNAFDPERFMGTAREKIHRFQYLPFGVGERVCIGQRFAMQEALILIACLIRNYRFDYEDAQPPWPVMRITVMPENDMPMRVSKR